MTEKVQRNSVIDYIHTVVTHNTNASEGITTALRQYENFLLSTLTEHPGTPTLQLPIVVEHSVFKRITKPLPELNGDTPPVAIFKTIANETGISLSGEVEIFKRIKKNRQRSTTTDVFVLHEEDTIPRTKPEKLFRADRQVKDGEIYSSITALRRRGVDLGYVKLHSLLADLPTAVARSRNGKPVLLYSEKEAEKAITQWIEKAARKSALKESRPYKLDPAVWVPTTHYINVYDISGKTVKRILHKTSTTTFGRTRYYRRDQADEAFKEHYSKKPVNGIYFRDNEPHITAVYLSKRTGIDRNKVEGELSLLANIDESTGYTLYSLVNSLEILNQITGIPHVASDGIYTDKDGKKWAGRAVLKNLLGISDTKLNEYLEGADTISIRGKRGKPKAHNISAAYDIAQIRERASSYLSLPTLKEAKAKDSSLIIAEDLAAEYGLPTHVIRSLLSSMSTPLRDDKVKVAYPKEDARARLDAFIALPKMDRRRRQYKDVTREIYVAKTEARRRLHTSDTIINEAIDTGEIRQVTARGQIGTFELYSLADLRAYKQRPRPRRTRSDKVGIAALEQEGRNIIASGGRLDSSLRKTNSGFDARVGRNYPGGLAALREKLGVGDTVKKKVPYADMKQPKRNARLEAEGVRIMKEGIELFPSELRANHSGFEKAVRKYYTKGGGGLEGLRKVLQRKNRKT